MTKLALPAVSLKANNVPHYMLISPITSHNILLSLLWVWSRERVPVGIAGSCPLLAWILKYLGPGNPSLVSSLPLRRIHPWIPDPADKLILIRGEAVERRAWDLGIPRHKSKQFASEMAMEISNNGAIIYQFSQLFSLYIYLLLLKYFVRIYIFRFDSKSIWSSLLSLRKM